MTVKTVLFEHKLNHTNPQNCDLLINSKSPLTISSDEILDSASTQLREVFIMSIFSSLFLLQVED